jgi:hypothetical protein
LRTLSGQIDEVEVNSFPQLELVLQSHLKKSHLKNGMEWLAVDHMVIFAESSVDLVQSWIFTLADFVSAKSIQGDSL